MDCSTAAESIRFYVDDQLLATFTWELSEVYTGVLGRGAVLVCAALDTATNQNADYAAHYDRFSLKTVFGNDCKRDKDDRRGDRQN